MDVFWQNVWVKNLLIPAAVFFLFFTVSVPLVRGLFTLLHGISEKTGGDWYDKLEYAFHKPLRLMVAVSGLYIALYVCPAAWGNASLQTFATRCFRSFLVAAVTWGFCRMTDVVELHRFSFVKKLDLKVNETLLPVLSGVARFVLVSLAVLIIAQEWSFSISGLVAGLGLGGLAFALAAKDMLSNLFGGLVILLDHPFTIGDWIRTGDVEGIVEEVNFRSMKIRTFEQALVTVPNSMVADAPVYNFSRMGKRRIEFNLTVEYGYSAEQLEACAVKIGKLLENSEKIESGTSVAALNSLDDSGPTYKVICYIKVTDYSAYLLSRGDLYYHILKLLEEEKIELAYPTSSVIVQQKAKEP